MLCELRPWLIDSLNFMIEQLELAKEQGDHVPGLDAAMGLVPFLRQRLMEDRVVAARFANLLDSFIDDEDHRKTLWAHLAGSSPSDFAESANDLIEKFIVLKESLSPPEPIRT
jgi:hypothetical protein